jgi:hypothetical protein
MSFRLIRNKIQEIAVKGFIITAIGCGIVALFIPWSIEVTSPFLLAWVMVWIIGASSNTQSPS